VSPTPAERLRDELKMQGILTLPPDEGGITDLLCDMDECYNPRGRADFQPLSVPLQDWMPSEDHYPKLKKDLRKNEVGKVRLAHRLCNRVDYGNHPGHVKQRYQAAAAAARWHKENWKQSAANASDRGQAEVRWAKMRESAKAKRAERSGGLGQK
jgi:hypothetical protein